VNVDFAELWHYRELLLFQVLRGIKVRYKRTALGAAWAILQPVLTMAAFTIFFGRLAGVPSDVSQPGTAALSNEAVARLRQQSGERENRIGHAVG
jgi:ABC-type polysaccharide/polyol phosphate export permease